MPEGFQDPEHQEFTRLYLLHFLPSSLTNPAIRASLEARARAIHRLLVQVLHEGITSGEFRPLDAEATAALAVASGDGLGLHALTLGTLAPARAMYQTWIESVRAAVRPEPLAREPHRRLAPHRVPPGLPRLDPLPWPALARGLAPYVARAHASRPM